MLYPNRNDEMSLKMTRVESDEKSVETNILEPVMNAVKNRYEHILKDFYPSWGSVGFTERNLTHNFCAQYEALSDNEDLVVWQEAPVKYTKEHVDSLIIDEDTAFMIEAKRIMTKSEVDSIKADVERMEKIANTSEEKLKGIKNVKHLYIVVVADFWRTGKTEKEQYLIDFKREMIENGLTLLDEKTVRQNQSCEEYNLLCAFKKVR